MASGLGPSIFTPEAEPTSFHRSRSRIFYQSDCSTPTSWQFHEIPEDANGNRESPMTPMPLALSILRMPGCITPSEVPIDGSRNSTGSSSSGSHRSQDSGFSDSGNCAPGEPGRRNLNRNRNYARYVINQSHDTTPGPNDVVSTRSENPVSVIVNGTPAYMQRSISVTKNCWHNLSQECSKCFRQDVLISRPIRGEISPLPEEIEKSSPTGSSNLGAPNCCSTPIKSVQNMSSQLQQSHSRISIMQKIDNFESLNKNMKLRDRNNNSSTNNSSNSNGHFLSLTSASPAPTSVSHNSSQEAKTSNLSSIANHSQSVVVRDDSMATTTTMVNEFTNYASRSKVFVKNSPKFRSLPRGYKRVPINGTSSDKLIVKSQFDNPSMRLWLHELSFQTEPECLDTLQVKDFPKDIVSFNDYKFYYKLSDTAPKRWRSTGAISTPILSIRSVERVASLISGEFSKICKHLELSFLPQVPSLVLNLVDHIDEFLIYLQESFGNIHKVEKRLATSCYELRLGVMAVIDGENGHHFKHPTRISDEDLGEYLSPSSAAEPTPHVLMIANLVEGIVNIGNLFSNIVDQRLTRDLSSLLDVIERPGLGASVALQSLATILSDGGMHLCRLAANIRTVRGLLSALLDARDEREQTLALRCLSTVLCVGQAVKDFDKAGGFEIVADILYEPGCKIGLKYEAVAALTQATDPWIDLETTLCSLGTHLEKIVVSLTNLIPQCKTDEDGFLLTIAAISNLTFLEVSSIGYLRYYKTVFLIIDAIREKLDFSVFVMDHVATVLANMAGAEDCRHDIVQSGGVVILLHFLQSRPPLNSSQNEITAYERLQQKSTIAISRLANEPGVAQAVMETGGIERLVQLSTQEKERNYSDGVLIACLATLRKLVAIAGDEIIKKLNAEELIQPRLLDSFLLFSSRQESYV